MPARSVVANNAKTKTDNALAKVGKAFSWTGKLPVSRGDSIKATDIEELRQAVDLAYDNRVLTGCTGHCSGYFASNYGDCSNYTADLGSNYDMYCSDNSRQSNR